MEEEEAVLDPLLMKFLDADTYEDQTEYTGRSAKPYHG